MNGTKLEVQKTYVSLFLDKSDCVNHMFFRLLRNFLIIFVCLLKNFIKNLAEIKSKSLRNISKCADISLHVLFSSSSQSKWIVKKLNQKLAILIIRSQQSVRSHSFSIDNYYMFSACANGQCPTGQTCNNSYCCMLKT